MIYLAIYIMGMFGFAVTFSLAVTLTPNDAPYKDAAMKSMGMLWIMFAWPVSAPLLVAALFRDAWRNLA